MNNPITPLTTWDGWPRLSSADLRDHFPDACVGERRNPRARRCIDATSAGGREIDDEPVRLLLLSGPIRIDAALWQHAEDADWTHIAVDGDLHLDGLGHDEGMARLFFVSGDLHADSVKLGELPSNAVAGRIVCHCAWLYAGDDCAMRTAPELRLDTRFLFAWFYSIDDLAICPEAVIFILGNPDYCASLGLPNPAFQWHEDVHVLAEPCVAVVAREGVDADGWMTDTIERALSRGQSIYRDGVDIASYPYHRAAQEAAGLGDHRGAYLLHRKSASISPGYYEAWYGMGDALFAAGAYRQALAAYHRAGVLFPPDQHGLVNRAWNDGALCALLLGQLDSAIALASLSIDHNNDTESKYIEHAHAYRYRAEAWLLSGRSDAACADLEQALGLCSHDEASLWLMGLACHRRGDADQARFHHAAANQYHSTYAALYDAEGGTAHLYQEPGEVDWHTLPLDALDPPPRDEAYWRDFMRHNGADALWKVPLAQRSAALCLEVAQAAGPHKTDYLKDIPAAAYTPELAQHLVASAPGLLRLIPAHLIDKALCMSARPGSDGFSLDHVPAALCDADICTRAVQCGERIDRVPPAYLSRDLCLAAVRAHPGTLACVPGELLDDDLIAAAIAHGDHATFDQDLPELYKTPALLERALDGYKCALDAIPGNRFDGALFAFAHERYGRDQDWPDIVARHGQAVVDAGASALACWSVFWDEPFMLAQIARRKKQRLAPSSIPARCYNDVVAEAAFRREPDQLHCIPPAFVTQAMCDQASSANPGALERIPLRYRTPAICARALAANPANLPLVPLALRSVDACVRAVRQKKEYLGSVPGALRAEVIDILIADHRKRIDEDWLERNRGLGEAREPGDFDPRRFAQVARDLDMLAVREDYPRALVQAGLAENLLDGAGWPDPALWAHVLDKKRAICHHLALVAAKQA
ncbi:hypothetical protein F2P45_00545 [Massilia sp. CCM 8733]|uniref:Tetratricopeptide repeat protein n=1 Tax=Massilia mucilaginosa TaxID=2609282 RepID=A0ABX0NL46_9BURK|nr:tetratricopeptide repeat protein [Massilia mucilaginosa]NHZ87528.1 hypothetical protein [Massilia mucilaginosa]